MLQAEAINSMELMGKRVEGRSEGGRRGREAVSSGTAMKEGR